MTGTIRLYNENGKRVRTLFYYSLDERSCIFERWRNHYGEDFENWYYHIIPFVHISQEPKVINIDTNKKRPVINNQKPLKDIEMDDFVKDKGMTHETYWHRCYCKDEKRINKIKPNT